MQLEARRRTIYLEGRPAATVTFRMQVRTCDRIVIGVYSLETDVGRVSWAFCIIRKTCEHRGGGKG